MSSVAMIGLVILFVILLGDDKHVKKIEISPTAWKSTALTSPANPFVLHGFGKTIILQSGKLAYHAGYTAVKLQSFMMSKRITVCFVLPTGVALNIEPCGPNV